MAHEGSLRHTPASVRCHLFEELRTDPVKYTEFRDRVLSASTDRERAELLVGFATDYAELRKLMPEVQKDVAAPALTQLSPES